MISAVPGYMHEMVPVPQAGQGDAVHDVEVKKSVHVPCAQTWSAAHATPQLLAWAEQCSGLEVSCCRV